MSDDPPLRVLRADEIDTGDDGPRWVIEHLWPDSAVGVIGGQPKSWKSWLGLELAVAVASGTPRAPSRWRHATSPIAPLVPGPMQRALPLGMQRNTRGRAMSRACTYTKPTASARPPRRARLTNPHAPRWDRVEVEREARRMSRLVLGLIAALAAAAFMAKLLGLGRY